MWLDFHSPLTPVYFFFLKECLALVLSVLAGDGVIPSDFLCLNYPAFSFFLRSCIAWVRRWMLQNFLKELRNKISNASLGATRHERGTWKGEKKKSVWSFWDLDLQFNARKSLQSVAPAAPLASGSILWGLPQPDLPTPLSLRYLLVFPELVRL